MLVYDPPSGWLYGFPKPYKPLPGETLADTLRRDGYPQKEIAWGGDKHIRFIGSDDELASLDAQLSLSEAVAELKPDEFEIVTEYIKRLISSRPK